MKTITRITNQVKTDKLNIFLNGNYAFSLFPITYAKFKLGVGQELSLKKIEEIILFDKYEVLKEKCFNYLTYRPRSKKEMKDYINKNLNKDRANIPEKVKETIRIKIIKILNEYSYIDDVAFANWWVKERLRVNKGINIIRNELYNKGIKEETIRTELRNIDTKKGLERMMAKARKRYDNEPDTYKRKQKILRYVQSKGYNYGEILELLENVKE